MVVWQRLGRGPPCSLSGILALCSSMLLMGAMPISLVCQLLNWETHLAIPYSADEISCQAKGDAHSLSSMSSTIALACLFGLHSRWLQSLHFRPSLATFSPHLLHRKDKTSQDGGMTANRSHSTVVRGTLGMHCGCSYKMIMS